jgi:23S rRNA G2445 N2-methylase RlmL
VRLIATRSEETMPALVHELEAAGATELTPAFRAVEFTADEALCYELHLRLRTASRDIRRRSRRRSPPRS